MNEFLVRGCAYEQKWKHENKNYSFDIILSFISKMYELHRRLESLLMRLSFPVLAVAASTYMLVFMFAICL